LPTASKSDLLRRLPSIDELLRTAELRTLISAEGRAAVTEAARTVLNRIRAEIDQGRLDANAINLALSGLHEAIERELRRALSFSLRTVINATGVILHTNLGRAPLAQSALEHILRTAAEYSNLEFDLSAGDRGKRDVHVDRLFRKLLEIDGQPVSTIVVNNNAAAVLLALNTLAENGEVIVSRGELVEIGGSFRIPDIMSKSQATLREVGTTNRTRIQDYEKAITEKTKLLLRVHRSNFEITGFTEQPDLAELVELSRQHKIPLMEDLGSGALVDLRAFGIAGEPSVFDSLRAGVDIVTYSGDKFLGGPQAGIVSGGADLVSKMRANSLFRALRVDKLTYAALEATLLAYIKEDHDAIPALRMMRISKDDIAKRAESLATTIRSTGLHADLIDGESVIGGGAAPSATLPTKLIAISPKNLTADELCARLRAADPPIIARVQDGCVLLDLRTVFPEQDAAIARTLATI
jgi:L-seryl-tRNA(Ser) seleniumtransferase